MTERQDARYPNLFSPIDLGAKRLRNRIVHASFTTVYGKDARITDRFIDYHANRARGGAAMIVTEPLSARPSSGARIYIFDEGGFDGFRRLAAAVEGEDCRLLGQFQDPGRGHHRGGRNLDAIGASPLPDDLSWTVPHALTTAEVEALVETFGRAAARLKSAGFSGVEVSCGHGHLFHQFLSPWSNRRDDKYGGDVDGRTRLVQELVDAIRAECGRDFILGLKLPGEDGVEGGIGSAEAERIAMRLAQPDRIDYIAYAQGSHAPSLEMHAPDMHFPRAPYLDITRRLRPAANGIPVAALGRITDPGQAEAALADGTAELVMMGRTLLADPAWPIKAQAGREHDIRYCVSCNNCWGTITAGRPIACDNNPRAGTADEVAWRPAPAATKKRVVVVGAGIAGLEAAWVAAARGHDVILFGASGELGGKTRLHAAMPGCDDLTSIADYQQAAAERSGVRFDLGRPAALDDIRAHDPEVVVLATGARMSWPESLPTEWAEMVPDLRQVAADLLRVRARQHGAAVIYDKDHTAGTYAAATLARERFDRVVLLTPRHDVARDEPLVTIQGIYRRLYMQGIEIVTLATPAPESRLDEGRIAYANVYTGAAGEIGDVALFTYATPRVPNDELAAPLRAAGIDVRLVGDCYAPRNVMTATREGHAAGNDL